MKLQVLAEFAETKQGERKSSHRHHWGGQRDEDCAAVTSETLCKLQVQCTPAQTAVL